MMRQAQSLPTHIFRNPYIQVAAEMHALTRRNNDIRRRAKIQSEASPNFFSRLFKTVAGPAVTYLMACIMETHFVEIRKGALKALNKSYLDQHGGVLVKDLVQILGFDDTDECLINCQQYDLELTNHSQAAVIFGRKDQATRRRIFKESSLALKQHRNLRIVEAKRTNYSIADIVFGRTPKPHEALGKRQSIAAPMMGSTDRMGMGLVSASSASRLVPAVGIPSPAVSRVSAFSPAPQLPPSSSQPASSGPFNFGVGQLAAPTAAPAVSPFSLAGAAAGAAVTAFAASASRTANAPAAGGSSTGTWPSSALNPAAPPFQPVAPNGFSFTSAAATIAAAPAPVSAATQITPSNLVQPPILSASGPYPAVPQASQPIPAFTFKTPEKEGGSANPFAFDAGKPTTAPPLFTLPPLGSAATEATKTSTAPPISITTNRNIPGLSTGRPLPLATPPIQSPIVPKSDATRVVSKRGRIYPRTVVQAVVEEFLDREVDRMTRTTVAQLAQEVAKERTVQRAEQRKQRIWTESTLLASLVLDNVVEEMIEEIQAELFRERKLQQKVITRWKEHTIRSRRRAEELKRRQDHFLAEVKAMGSRAGLVPGSGLGSGAGSVEGVKSMVETVMNKRKRMLSIGQEGSLDEALMEGLKRAAAPKREMWAPLPVYKIVDSHYRHRRDTSLSRPGSGLESGTEAGSALVKRRWRLFVNTPTFKEMGSKWLLTKLGVDMGRQTKSQQRSGAMVAVHRGSNENLDVVIHGIEDRSVVDLLGMSKYSIMETAAFMFEFSKVTLLDRDATEETIRQYWLGERARLVRFLACFPKVKQPLVFIMWTTSPEIWERMSPRVVELLELDEMVASERGPLRSYRFLVMDMSMMKLDPYVTGSLEWLASETRDFFEDPAVLLKELLDKYQPILDWGLCRISLAGAPFYSQYDEEDGDLHMINVRRRMKQQQRQKQMRAIANGTTPEPMIEWTPRSLFVEAAETGFNLAVRMFNQELESLARTIEVKGHGDTREGAAQEGRVKDAMARFVRQAELKEMKRGSIQDRINYGMDPKSAFCDYMDVFIATMGGLAKEHKNIESKTRMRTEIWEMLTTSREDRVPLEAAFKRITSQVLAWVQDGILDAKRFNVRLRKWNEQRQDLVQQQQQFQQQQSLQDTQPRGTFGDNEDQDQQSLDGDNEAFVDADGEPQGDHEQTFRPMLIDDDIDIEGIVFEYEMTVQTEIRDWEMKVEQMVRDLEETAKLVPTELETSTMTTSGLRLGGSRKRRAPERPRNALKKTRLAGAARFGRNGSVTEMNKEESLEVKEEDMNLFMSTTTVDDNILPLKKWAATLPDNKPPNGMVRDMEDSAEARLSGVAALSQLVRSLTPTLAITATTTTMMSTPSRPLTPSILAGNTLAVSNTTTPSILKPTPILGQALTGMNAATTGSTGGDRLARLRNLIKDVKTSALLAKQPHQQ
ncbi:hypothetical protein BGW38_007829 [Lunasporangiospora selenospora]|uniref:SAC3/GANP/THP3 conserved domain-containing protein n=1 Tax=Lunasporangiospora selenospora TaxID=979761 RepID=A0A9P6FYY9_9FUNG|nr:hypothetical protein BGW38_007829 [Lunasporangiospora selenospora]